MQEPIYTVWSPGHKALLLLDKAPAPPGGSTAIFDDDIRLIGTAVRDTPRGIELEMHWEKFHAMRGRLARQITIVDDQGRMVDREDDMALSSVFGVNKWQLDQVVVDTYRIKPPRAPRSSPRGLPGSRVTSKLLSRWTTEVAPLRSRFFLANRISGSLLVALALLAAASNAWPSRQLAARLPARSHRYVNRSAAGVPALGWLEWLSRGGSSAGCHRPRRDGTCQDRSIHRGARARSSRLLLRSREAHGSTRALVWISASPRRYPHRSYARFRSAYASRLRSSTTMIASIFTSPTSRTDSA